MTSTLVNVSRNEVVDALRGAYALQQADTKALSAAIEAALGQSAAPKAEADLAIMQVVTDTLIGLTADSMILGDRSSPLLRREAMLEAVQFALRSTQFDVDDDTKPVIEAAIESIGSSVVDFVDGLRDAPEKSHDRAWNQVNAYRQLVTEHGVVDPSDQKLRDEFVRLSSDEADWIEQTEKVTKSFATGVRKMIDTITGSLLETLAAQDGLNGDEIAELKKMMEAELGGMFTKQMDDAAREIQSYRDRRFMEIWVIPGLNGA